MLKIYNLKKIAIGIFALSMGASHYNAQVSSYTFSQATNTFNPITAGTVLATATGTSGVSSLYQIPPIDVPIPFNFSFNGNIYTSCKVTSNGFVTFGATTPSTSNSTPISGNESYDGSISVFGKSLNSFANLGGLTGDIRTDIVGTSPNRELVIQWTNFKPAYSTSTTSAYAYTFQIKLKETTNVIDVVYGNGAFAIGSSAVTGTSQIGLRGASNADYNNRLNASTLAFTSSTSGTANTSTQYFSTTTSATAALPPAGFTYSWAPPTCFAPTLTTDIVTPNSITVNWASPTLVPGSYDVYHSTSNTAPTSTTTPTQTGITTTTATINSLNPTTQYYVWVRSNCGSGNFSGWSPEPKVLITQCAPPSVTTTGATICPGSTAILNATSTTTSAVINWYDSTTSATPIASGNTYTTPALATTTSYYASSANISPDSYTGKNAPVATTGNSTVGEYGLNVNAYLPMIIKEVDVYPMHATNTSGTITIDLKDYATNSVLATTTTNINISATGELNTIPLNFKIPAGGSYRLVVSAATNIANLRREISSNMNYPYELAGICSIPSARFGSTPASTSYYYYLYNWKVSSICESPRQQVTATVDSAACLSTAETATKANLKIYPNPFSETINLDKSELVKTAKVMDISGKLIRTINNPQSTISLQNLSQGLYILNLEMKDGSKQSSKIIKK